MWSLIFKNRIEEEQILQVKTEPKIYNIKKYSIPLIICPIDSTNE